MVRLRNLYFIFKVCHSAKPQVIDDIYEFVESCKLQPLSQTKLIVPKDEMYDLLDEPTDTFSSPTMESRIISTRSFAVNIGFFALLFNTPITK